MEVGARVRVRTQPRAGGACARTRARTRTRARARARARARRAALVPRLGDEGGEGGVAQVHLVGPRVGVGVG